MGLMKSLELHTWYSLFPAMVPKDCQYFCETRHRMGNR